MIDDRSLLLQDERIRNINHLYFQFIPDFRKNFAIENAKSDVYYRPLQHSLIMVFYLFFRDSPVGYHCLNLFLFFFCAWLLYFLLNLILKDENAALLTAVLFCVHPINGIIVNYITAFVFALQVAAMLLSFTFFWLAQGKKMKLVYYSLSLLFYAASFLCHETALILPVYVMAGLFLIKRYDFKRILKLSVPYFIVLAGYLVFRWHTASLKTSIVDKATTGDFALVNYLATFFKLIFWYLQKFFLFKGIVFIWITPLVKDTLLWLMLGAALIFGAVLFIYFYRSRQNFVLALVWFSLGLAPVSLATFFQKHVGFMMEPHWVIFGSIGLFLLTALFLIELKNKINIGVWYGVVSLLVVTLIIMSRTYNGLWKNEKTYCQYWIGINPEYRSLKFHLASAYLDEGNWQEAQKLFRESLENQFTDYQTYINLGLIDLGNNNLDSAVDNFKKALVYNPNSALAYDDLGVAYLRKQDSGGAKIAFLKSLTLNPFLREPALNLVNIYRSDGNDRAARSFLLKNLELDPEDESSLWLLIQIAFSDKNKDEITLYGERLIKVSRDPQLLTDLGSLSAQSTATELAQKAFAKALKVSPNFKNTYVELGKFYGNLENFDQAIAVWQEGLRFYPDEKQFGQLIAQAKQLKETGSPFLKP